MKPVHLSSLLLSIVLLACNAEQATNNQDVEEPEQQEEDKYQYRGEPLKVGVVGLVHTHVHWILGRDSFGDIEIVGIVEPNRELAQRYSKQHGYSMDIVFDSIEEMVEATRPEAVTAFNTIYDHLEVVKYCAPRRIHVMVEKPLAVNLEHAREMAELARQHNIFLLTNYETSWYGSNEESYRIINQDKAIGDIRKMVFHHGHQGPEEIGVNSEFLEWLIDPIQNGGGALTDFGCYGANLATWMMKGEKPVSVSCITQQIKPEKYPLVEDEATILLSYPKSQVIIQASWNWSHNRKDMEVYGTTGYVIAKNGTNMEILEKEEEGPFFLEAPPLKPGRQDPFALFASLLKKGMVLPPMDVSSLENNLIVMQILEAAKVSAQTGKVVQWDEYYPE